MEGLCELAGAFVLDGDWRRVLAAAEAYGRGGAASDEDAALGLYHLCASCPDGEVSGLGQAGYVGLRAAGGGGAGGGGLPRGPAELIAGEARELLRRAPEGEYQTPQWLAAGDRGAAEELRRRVGELRARHGLGPEARVDAFHRARHAVLEWGGPAREKGRALEALEGLTDAGVGWLGGASGREVLALAVAEAREEEALEGALVGALAGARAGLPGLLLGLLLAGKSGR